MNRTIVGAQDRRLHLDILQVPVYAPLFWLRNGWLDMRRNWGASLSYGALIVAIGWTLLVVCGTHPYFVAAAISGFLLVGPLMSAGLCEMSRRYSLGESANFDNSLEGFARNAPALIKFGAILAICAATWFLISAVLLGTVFHVTAPGIQETLYSGFLDSANRSQVFAYIAVGGVLATAVFMLSVVAIPLIIDRTASAKESMRVSVLAVLRNVPAMIVWSGLILVLTIIGYASLLAALVIIGPLLGHATWHAYLGMLSRPLELTRTNSLPQDALAQVGTWSHGVRGSVAMLTNPNDAREGHLRKVRKLKPQLR